MGSAAAGSQIPCLCGAIGARRDEGKSRRGAMRRAPRRGRSGDVAGGESEVEKRSSSGCDAIGGRDS
jgi:hypothetical protein